MPTYREWHRSSLRLEGYDYAQEGVYFITICSHQRQCLFGDIHEGQMRLNAAVGMVQENWENLSRRFPFLVSDAFVVMPNYLHGIISLIGQDVTTPAPDTPAPDGIKWEKGRTGEEGRTQGSPLRASMQEYRHPSGTESGTISRVIQAFKSITTVQYTQGVKHGGWAPFDRRIWQRDYHDHIIRHEQAMNSTREYIVANPAAWAEDADNPENPLKPA